MKFTQPGLTDPHTTTINVTCPTGHTELSDRTCQAPATVYNLKTRYDAIVGEPFEFSFSFEPPDATPSVQFGLRALNLSLTPFTGPFIGARPVNVAGTPTHTGEYTVTFALTQSGRTDPHTTTVIVTCPAGHTQLFDGTCQAPVCTQSLGTGQILSGAVQASGSWETGCVLPTGRRGNSNATYYAKHYTFSLPRPASVTIDLTSDDQDTYLFLIRGNNPNGTLISRNDDHGSGDGTNILNSRLRFSFLDAGHYTVSASTYHSGERTGAFEVQLTACVSRDVLLSGVCYSPVDPANGAPVSPTGCSRAKVVTTSKLHGINTLQTTSGINSNFSPGRNGGRTGPLVPCDTLVRQVSLLDRNPPDEWSNTDYAIGTDIAYVVAYKECPWYRFTCESFLFQFYEATFLWREVEEP